MARLRGAEAGGLLLFGFEFQVGLQFTLQVPLAFMSPAHARSFRHRVDALPPERLAMADGQPYRGCEVVKTAEVRNCLPFPESKT